MAKTSGIYVDGTQVRKNLTAYVTAGAIPVESGIATLGSSGALAMTLAAPTAGSRDAGGDDGKEIIITAVTAHAHTVTTPANKIQAANATDDTVTFAHAGDTVRLVAVAGLWLVLGLLGATLSEV